jgi:hypothetical protein
VADDDRAAGEIFDGRLKRLEGLDVEVVGRFVRGSNTLPPDFNSLAMWTRLRSPPESNPTFFCWSVPLKLNAPV